MKHFKKTIFKSFNPRPREEGDICMALRLFGVCAFQSTPS